MTDYKEKGEDTLLGLKIKMDKAYKATYGEYDEESLKAYHKARTAYNKKLYADRIVDTWGDSR